MSSVQIYSFQNLEFKGESHFLHKSSQNISCSSHYNHFVIQNLIDENNALKSSLAQIQDLLDICENGKRTLIQVDGSLLFKYNELERNFNDLQNSKHDSFQQLNILEDHIHVIERLSIDNKNLSNKNNELIAEVNNLKTRLIESQLEQSSPSGLENLTQMHQNKINELKRMHQIKETLLSDALNKEIPKLKYQLQAIQSVQTQDIPAEHGINRLRFIFLQQLQVQRKILIQMNQLKTLAISSS